MTNIFKNQLKNCISKGLDFLYKNQLPYGEFRTYLSPDKEMEGKCRYVSTTYITTFVIYSLGFIKDLRVDEITKKALNFLIQEMEPEGVWGFFGTNRSARISGGSLIKYTPMGIIPDLDDTACVSYCLKANGVEIPDNRRFFENNRNEHGLFYTWLMDYPKRKEYDENTVYLKPKTNDICCGVLSNVLLYLGENEDTKCVCDYINRIIHEGSEDSSIPYFPNKMTLYYLLSRAFYNGALSLGKSKELVLERMREMAMEDDSFGSPQSTAYAVCTLLNFSDINKSIHKAITYLVKTQNEDGSWNRERFCDEYIRCYASEELTTSICIEALSRYERGL